MPKETFTEEELSHLSPEEREAVQDEEEAKAEISEETPEEPPDEPPEEPPEEPLEEEPAEASAEEPAEVHSEAPAEVPSEAQVEQVSQKDVTWDEINAAIDNSPPEPFMPRFEVSSDVSGIDKKLEEIEAKFEEGELTLKQYNSQRDSLQLARAKAELASEFNTATPEQQWKAAQDSFFAIRENRIYKDHPIYRGALDHTIKTLARTPEFENLTGPQVLNVAKLYVEKELGKPGLRVAKEQVTEKKIDAPKQAPSKKENITIPKTLGGIPSAKDVPTRSKGEFAYLDKLTGEDYEEALAKLTPAQQKKWLEG